MATLLNIAAGRVPTVATFYQASELLGTGRFAEVYRAFDKHHQVDVALKLYTGYDNAAHELAAGEAAVLNRLRELNSEFFPALRQSVKPRINNRNHPLLVLELGAIVGESGQKHVISLRNAIPRSFSSAPVNTVSQEFWRVHTLIRWIIQMAQAVKQLHSIGLIHRDIKPANILLKRGPGRSEFVPFLLDFNSAKNTLDLGAGSGTPRYLPPEVVMRKRQTPSPADDLWAIARVSWEIFFGQEASSEKPTKPLGIVEGIVPEDLIEILSRALSLEPDARYSTADELLAAVESCLPGLPAGTTEVSSDQMANARMQMERIRRTSGETLTPPTQIFVPKEVDDAITTIFARLSQDDSQSLNLAGEILSLGPTALPAALQQGYRLQRGTPTYQEVVTALSTLAQKSRSLAERSIGAFALSSNRGVRELCRRVCAELGYFPEMFTESLIRDEDILLPEERLELADLCIRFSSDETSTPTLIKYICREYLFDKARYRVIRDSVARRMNEVQHESAARLIWESCEKRCWIELKEFRDLPASAKHEYERGMVELFADAFASVGVRALAVLKAKRSPRPSGPEVLPVFRRFSVKAGRAVPEIHAWLTKEAQSRPQDWDLQKVVENLGSPKKTEKTLAPGQLLQRYLSGDAAVFNELRFWATAEVLQIVKTKLSGGCSQKEIRNILQLLRGYEGRLRWAVVDAILGGWPALAAHDYESTAEILVAYSVPRAQQDKAVAILNEDLGGVHDSTARLALKKLLLR